MERRWIPQNTATIQIEERGEGEDKKRVITGYGAVFYRDNDPGTEFELWDGVIERIENGAFDRAIKEKDDARGLFNHDPNMLLGRVSAGTMALISDKNGLRYEIDINDDDPDHERVVRKIQRGDLTGSSFSFRVKKQEWIGGEEKEPDIRLIKDVELFDTGPVTFPAYESTTTGVRSELLAEVRSNYNKWKADLQKEKCKPVENINRRFNEIKAKEKFGSIPG